MRAYPEFASHEEAECRRCGKLLNGEVTDNYPTCHYRNGELIGLDAGRYSQVHQCVSHLHTTTFYDLTTGGPNGQESKG